MNNDHSQSAGALWWWVLGWVLGVFSLISGKLMTYILPAALPIAVLAAGGIERWLQQNGGARVWWWCVRPWVSGAGAGLALLAGAWWWHRQFGQTAFELVLWLDAAAGLGLVACVFLGLASGLRRWGWRPAGWALSGAWLVAVAGVLVLMVAEDVCLERHSVAKNVAQIRAATGLRHPHIMTVGFADHSLIYHTNRPTDWLDPRILEDVWSRLDKRLLVVLARPDAWRRFDSDPHWDLSRRYERLPLDLCYGIRSERLEAYRVRPEFW